MDNGRIVAEKENISVKIGASLLLCGDVVHIKHDDILVFEVGKPSVQDVVFGDCRPVDFGRVDERRTERYDVSTVKISAV